MNLDRLLTYLARGALSALEAITAELHLEDLKALRHISRQVSVLLVPYVFDVSEKIYISAYAPDLEVAHAVLANPLLRCRVRSLVWDYSLIDGELLHYCWYDAHEKRICGADWQFLCTLMRDQARILAGRLDVRTLQKALRCLPNLASIQVVHANRYVATDPTVITLTRHSWIKSPTTAALGSSDYSIRLVEPAVPPRTFVSDREVPKVHEERQQIEPDRLGHLVYREDFGGYDRRCWVVKAPSHRIVSLLTSMAQAPNLRLREFVVSSSIWSESEKVHAWVHAFEQCPREVVTAWTSRMASVEKLELFIDDGVHAQTSTADYEKLQKRLIDILRASASLKDLQISNNGWDLMAMLSRPVDGDRPQYPKLRRVFVETAKLESKSLVRFCWRHMTSLQVLDIRNSHLGGGSWQDFLLDLLDRKSFQIGANSSQALAFIEGQTLNVRLDMVFDGDDAEGCYNTQCVYSKSVRRTGRKLELSTGYKDGAVQLVLQEARHCFPRLGHCEDYLCKVHSQAYTFYETPPSHWQRPLELASYK